MPHKSSRTKTTKRKTTVKTSKPRKKPAKTVATRTVTTEVRRIPPPVTDVITEERHIVTEPDVEVRRQATLAGALTNPPVAVIKPKTRVVRSVQRRKRVA